MNKTKQKIKVSPIPPSTTPQEIKNVFQKWGNVTMPALVMKVMGVYHTFVGYGNVEDAAIAVKNADNQVLFGDVVSRVTFMTMQPAGKPVTPSVPHLKDQSPKDVPANDSSQTRTTPIDIRIEDDASGRPPPSAPKYVFRDISPPPLKRLSQKKSPPRRSWNVWGAPNRHDKPEGYPDSRQPQWGNSSKPYGSTPQKQREASPEFKSNRRSEPNGQVDRTVARQQPVSLFKTNDGGPNKTPPGIADGWKEEASAYNAVDIAVQELSEAGKNIALASQPQNPTSETCLLQLLSTDQDSRLGHCITYPAEAILPSPALDRSSSKGSDQLASRQSTTEACQHQQPITIHLSHSRNLGDEPNSLASGSTKLTLKRKHCSDCKKTETCGAPLTGCTFCHRRFHSTCGSPRPSLVDKHKFICGKCSRRQLATTGTEAEIPHTTGGRSGVDAVTASFEAGINISPLLAEQDAEPAHHDNKDTEIFLNNMDQPVHCSQREELPRPARQNDSTLDIRWEAREMARRYRLVTCPYWSDEGCHLDEDDCIFAHWHTGIEPPRLNKATRDFTCRFWKMGETCQEHRECLFSHEDTGLYVGSDGFASTKHITCFFWHHGDKCRYTDATCLYAHQDTGIHQHPATVRKLRKPARRTDSQRKVQRLRTTTSTPLTGTCDAEPNVGLQHRGHHQPRPPQNEVSGKPSHLVAKTFQSAQIPDQAVQVVNFGGFPTSERRSDVSALRGQDLCADSNRASQALLKAEDPSVEPTQPPAKAGNPGASISAPASDLQDLQLENVNLLQKNEDHPKQVATQRTRDPRLERMALLQRKSPKIVVEISASRSEKSPGKATPVADDESNRSGQETRASTNTTMKTCLRCLKKIFSGSLCRSCHQTAKDDARDGIQPSVGQNAPGSNQGDQSTEELSKTTDGLPVSRNSDELEVVMAEFSHQKVDDGVMRPSTEVQTTRNPLKRSADNIPFVTKKRPKVDAGAKRPIRRYATEQSHLVGLRQQAPPTIEELIRREAQRVEEAQAQTPSADDVNDIANGTDSNKEHPEPSLDPSDRDTPEESNSPCSNAVIATHAPYDLDISGKPNGADSDKENREPSTNPSEEASSEDLLPSRSDQSLVFDSANIFGTSNRNFEVHHDNEVVTVNVPVEQNGTFVANSQPLPETTGSRSNAEDRGVRARCQRCYKTHKRCFHGPNGELDPGKCKTYLEDHPDANCGRLGISAAAFEEIKRVSRLPQAEFGGDVTPFNDDMGRDAESSEDDIPIIRKRKRITVQLSSPPTPSTASDWEVPSPNLGRPPARNVGPATNSEAAKPMSRRRQPPHAPGLADKIAKLKKRGVVFESDSDEGPEEEPELLNVKSNKGVPWVRPSESRDLFEIAPSLKIVDDSRLLFPSEGSSVPKKQVWKNLLERQCRARKLEFGSPHHEIERDVPSRQVQALIQQEAPEDYMRSVNDRYHVAAREVKKATMTFEQFLGLPKDPIVCREWFGVGANRRFELAYRDGRKDVSTHHSARRKSGNDKYVFTKA